MKSKLITVLIITSMMLIGCNENNNSTNTKNVENSIEVREAKKGKICPRCGAALVLRTVKKGDRAGNKFFGCSEYPKCRYTENIQH